MKVTEIPVTCLVDSRDRLGEGCFWDVASQTLWWLDIIEPSAIHRLHVASGAWRKWQFTEKVTAMASRRDGTILVGTHTGLAIFNPETGALTPWRKIDPGMPGNRGNDGACDARGRFWFGTMMNNIGPLGEDLDITASTGRLFRVEADGTTTVMETDVGVSNGPCWSPDNRTFYFTDSKAHIIWAYDFDLDSGTISNRRVLNDTKDHGHPDGATVDAEGFIWSARWEGSCVLRIDPKGRIDRLVPMPARRVTNVCFGGAKLDTLYVTTSRAHIPDQDLRRHPLQGGLFCFNPGVTGFEKHRFAG
ncbi:SMP-30/gluconolactonase/LRE family protein [Aestuariivirga sp.]|uniref:SMP-30/gluconolactonase/LRE family protein n=1 Tax=Aestuariivirga sp. TaxID=2650926 RepID=UPI003BAC4298